MKVNITGRKMTVSDAKRERIEKKLVKFGKFFDEDAQANVTLSYVKNRQIVEITILNRGTLFRAQEMTDDFFASLDGAVEALERQMRKYKTRLEKRVHSAAYEGYDFAAEDVVEEEKEFEIVKTKRFSVKPMSVEEAILQMNLLGHSFFVFKNAESDEVDIVYRRNDGKYGLLTPDAESEE